MSRTHRANTTAAEHSMAEQDLTAYCVKCRQKRPLAEPQAGYSATAAPLTRGRCPVCGTVLT
ncbi:MAG: DUF5679 domain-containing protein, partial [Anaerolineae bacterium]